MLKRKICWPYAQPYETDQIFVVARLEIEEKNGTELVDNVACLTTHAMTTQASGHTRTRVWRPRIPIRRRRSGQGHAAQDRGTYGAQGLRVQRERKEGYHVVGAS